MYLPEEILVQIFNYLEIKDLIGMELLNKSIRKISISDGSIFCLLKILIIIYLKVIFQNPLEREGPPLGISNRNYYNHPNEI